MTSIKPNHTQIPNIYFDKVMHLLTGNEWKVLSYVSRRTFGFHKQSDRISLSQMEHGIKNRDTEKEQYDYGTGLTRKPIIKALKKLKELGLVSVEKGKINRYSLVSKLHYPEVVSKLHQTSVKTPPLLVSKLHPQKKGKKVNKRKVLRDRPAKVEIPFDFQAEMLNLKSGGTSDRKDYKIIALYWKTKGFEFENREQFSASLRRELRAAGSLKGYTGEQIARSIAHCRKEFPDMWTLETVGKRISEVINKKQ